MQRLKKKTNWFNKRVAKVSEKRYDVFLGRKYFLVFPPMLSSLTLDKSKKLLTGYGTEQWNSVKIIRNVDRTKFTYNGQEIAFDGKGYWSFDNDYAKSVLTFVVDNSLSSHTDNLKNKMKDQLKVLIIVLVQQKKN